MKPKPGFREVFQAPGETPWEALEREQKSGTFPADAQIFLHGRGRSHPVAPAGWRTVGCIKVRNGERWAVGVPA